MSAPHSKSWAWCATPRKPAGLICYAGATLTGASMNLSRSDKQLLSEHDVCGDMAEQGLRISKGQQGNLARYILGSTADDRVTLVNRIGWHEIADRSVVRHALPGGIGAPPGRVLC